MGIWVEYYCSPKIIVDYMFEIERAFSKLIIEF